MIYHGDMRKISRFIKDGTPCPTVLIIEHYLKCKHEGEEVPAKVEDFILSCLKAIVKNLNQGIKPKYDDIFKIKFKKGRNKKRFTTKLKEVLQVGVLMEDLMNEGNTYERSLEIVVGTPSIKVGTSDAVRKLYTEYRSIPDGPDHEPNAPPPDTPIIK